MHKNWVSVLQRNIEASESREFLTGKNLKTLFSRNYRENFTEQEAHRFEQTLAITPSDELGKFLAVDDVPADDAMVVGA